MQRKITVKMREMAKPSHKRRLKYLLSSTKVPRGFSCYTDMHWEHSKQEEKAFQLEDNTVARIKLLETCSQSI